MINTIPNPTRVVTVPFSTEDVKTALSNLPNYLNQLGIDGYSLENYDIVLSELRLKKSEFLSVGSRIIINTEYINDTNTKINVEIQRVIGVFDQRHEVSLAGKHINEIINVLSSLLQNPNMDLEHESLTFIKEQKKEGCYIATNVYGNYDAPQVLVLRDFRDDVLKHSFFGRLFITFYYKVAPSFVKITKNMKYFNLTIKNILNYFVYKIDKK